MHSARGLFVTLEGIEGAGKSTQASRLAESFRRAGHPCVETREPGGGEGPVGPALRRLLRDPDVWSRLELAEIYLYAAARAHHLESLILPALARGEAVVCDRFLDSTRAYQGAGRGRPEALIEALHSLPPLTRRPDRTLLLDLPPREGLARAAARPGAARGYDDADLAFFERVRSGFLAIARRESERVRIIDATGSVAAVHRRAVRALADLVPDLAPLPEDDR